MNFLHTRHARYFFAAILCTLLFFCLSSLFLHARQTEQVKRLMLVHDSAVAGSLLSDGVPAEVIVSALLSRDSSAEGEMLLSQTGYSSATSPWLLPLLSGYSSNSLVLLMSVQLIFTVLLGLLCWFYLFLTDRIYQNANRTIQQFAEGNFSHRLPGDREGALYQLFDSVQQLATSLKSRNEAELQTKEFLRNTVSDISHQLKTPLAALTMYSEIIAGESGDSEAVSSFIQKSQLSIERMGSLIQSLLKITRLDAGSIAFKRSHYQIYTIVEMAVRELEYRALKENKRLVFDISDRELVYCDREWTAEALGNLVKNALDHTDSGGVITIRFEQTPVISRIFVYDNGTGIAPEDIHHIFKRFYRSKAGSERQGTGLGLPLAKAIAEGQGGFLSVESTPGEGSAFEMAFFIS